MSLDVLWAGWRMPYITKAVGAKGANPKRCLFCAKGRERPGKGNLVLAKTPRVIAMLNLYPSTWGT